MRRAVLISREPVNGLGLATRLAGAGETVTAVLLDAAAAVARVGHADAPAIAAAVDAGAVISVHDEALRRRGIGEPLDGVKVVDLAVVADLLSEGTDRVIWT